MLYIGTDYGRGRFIDVLTEEDVYELEAHYNKAVDVLPTYVFSICRVFEEGEESEAAAWAKEKPLSP